MDTDFTSFLDGNGWGRKAWNVLRYKGVYKGEEFYQFMKELLAKKGVVYYGDLRDNSNLDDVRWRWRFKCFAADITNERLVTWPDDAGMYGINPDYLEVAWSVRTSMSIPYFYRPMKLNGTIFVDGGILSNFPIWLWDSPSAPTWPTFGILLDEQGQYDADNDIGFWPHEYFGALFGTMMKAHDRRFIRPGDYQYRTIKVPVSGVKTTDFGISSAKKEELYHGGFRAAKDFLFNWRWDDYLAWATKMRGV